jgi:hypothetical protein
MGHANDGLHKRAIAAAEALLKAKHKAGDYNERRREATLDYGKVMSEVWTKLEAGEAVGGITQKEVFCKLLNIKMRWTQTAIQRYRVSTGALSAPEPPVRVVTLKPGTLVRIGKRTFTVVNLGDITVPEDSEDEYGVCKIDEEIAKSLDHDHTAHLRLLETKTQQKKPKVTHARGVTHKGTCSTRPSLCDDPPTLTLLITEDCPTS